MSPEVKDIMNQAVIALFTLVILPAIPFFWKILKAYGDAKIAQIEDMRVKAAAEFAFQRLDHIVNNTVAAIAQVNEKNTALTKEEGAARKEKAFTFVRSQLTEKDTAVLHRAVKDFDSYLKAKIEATRYFQKNEVCK